MLEHDFGSLVGCVSMMVGGNPRNGVRYCHIPGGINNNAKLAASTVAAYRRNTGSIVIDLALGDLERSIGGLSSDL
jgi:hypothetical protein